ncbi:hypothetical protein TCAL_12406 [Tigriopus californicus]|uniref:Caspase family p20 domain-containing protein n=1 Tax=Tigriopus californicus TaxID=6832 RepID=A0A553PPD6_TIGCA|nr:hypothetical protein TCAL_12406 [Tigriopus californicus]
MSRGMSIEVKRANKLLINQNAVFDQGVTVRRNLTKTDLEYWIQEFACNNKHANASLCILVVLSHGYETGIVCTDGKLIEKEWLLNQFINTKSGILQDKPKFFIFQACRGNTPPGYNVTQNNTDCIFGKSDSGQSSLPRPLWRDCLIAEATIYGYGAYRHEIEGSIFIQSLCKVFMEHACDTDIRDMLDMVTIAVQSEANTVQYLQTPSYENRGFVKKLYFSPDRNRAAIHFDDNEPSETNEPHETNEPPEINELHHSSYWFPKAKELLSIFLSFATILE